MSGKWWYPIREFEFYADRTFEDVVNLIQNTFLLEHDDMKEYETEFGISEVYYEFLMHRTVSLGGMSACIESSVQKSGENTKFIGNIGIVNIFLYKIMIFAAVIMALPFFILITQNYLLEASICLVFHINFVLFYIPNIRKRDKFFNDFLESVLVGKIKNEHDISATPVKSEN